MGSNQFDLANSKKDLT